MSQPTTPRNRDGTAARILAAALDTLAEDGFAGFGINAVARRAGCDKTLIYRYFGGIDGVMAAVGRAAAERLSAVLDAALVPPPASYGALVLRLVQALAAHLRADPLYRQLRLAEAADPSASAAFREARGAALAAWMAAARGGLAPPPGVDAPALNALLIAAVEGAAVLGAAGGVDDARLDAALAALAGAAYP